MGAEIWHRITISGSRFKRLSFLPTYSCYPSTGSCTLSCRFAHVCYLLPTGSLCTLGLCARSSLPRQHNIICTRNFFRRIYISACRSKIINVLFPLRNPVNCAILIYGRMLTGMWIWSGHASASMISTFFSSQSFRIISPISFFNAPYIAFLRHFGANTMWYSHFSTLRI